LVLILGVGLFLAGGITGISIAARHPLLSATCFIIGLSAMITMMVVAHLHTGPKYADELSWPLSE
jgi:hypothetical protein